MRADTHVAPGHTAADGILAAIARHRVDLVVMSTHGRGGLGRFLYGSVADEVLRGADAPVLLVTAGCEGSWPRGGKLRVLVPLDGSDLARRALESLASLGHALPLEVVLARATSTPTTSVAMSGDDGMYAVALFADPEAELAAAREALGEEATRLRGLLDVVEVRVDQGRPATVIASLAREEGVHMIAMSTHGRGGLSRLVMGSVATGTLHHATVPVLLVPAAARNASLHGGAAPEAPLEVTLTLSPDEVALVAHGLELLESAAERDEAHNEALRDLRRRLDRSSAARELAVAP